MSKIVAFDFDGVICDSTDECLITGYNAWTEYNNGGNFIYHLDQVSPDIAGYFRPLRGYVRTAGQYFVIFNSLSSKSIRNENDFEEECKKYSTQIDSFGDFFFVARKKLKDNDIDYWIRLHHPYKGVKEGLGKIKETACIFVVTGKDKDSVYTFLEYYGIDLSEERIFDKDAAINKLAALNQITQMEGRSIHDIIFIDDNIKHLIEPKQSGYQVYMAEWGYSMANHIEIARDNNIPVIGLDNWIEVVLKN